MGHARAYQEIGPRWIEAAENRQGRRIKITWIPLALDGGNPIAAPGNNEVHLPPGNVSPIENPGLPTTPLEPFKDDILPQDSHSFRILFARAPAAIWHTDPMRAGAKNSN